MIGLDTNVLVRIFASDDAQQAASAVRVLDESKADQIFVNVVVLAEFAWTMRARLQMGRRLDSPRADPNRPPSRARDPAPKQRPARPIEQFQHRDPSSSRTD